MLVEANHPALFLAPHDAFDAVIGRLLERLATEPERDLSLERFRGNAGLGPQVPYPA